MKKLFFLFCLFLLYGFYGCSEGNSQGEDDIRLFKDTPVWPLAKAVAKEDVLKIEELIKTDKILINYQEPLYGKTLIEWAVLNEKYNSIEALLKLGANPNIRNNHDGHNALIAAADNFKDSKFLKLLLLNGADPNFNDIPKSVQKFPMTTPLITAALNSNIENVKMIVEAGADINFKTSNGNTALKQAALMNQVYIIKYLLIEKHADFNYVFMTTIRGVDLYLIDYMRDWPFLLESDKHKCKMEIVEFLRQHGMDYSKSPIPKDMIDSYPKEYLEKY